MRIAKPLAIFGFHFCNTVFVGLCAYGILRYMSEGIALTDSLQASATYAAMVLVSIAGICFFGREADRRKREEASARSEPPAPSTAVKKKKS